VRGHKRPQWLGEKYCEKRTMRNVLSFEKPLDTMVAVGVGLNSNVKCGGFVLTDLSLSAKVIMMKLDRLFSMALLDVIQKVENLSEMPIVLTGITLIGYGHAGNCVKD
jgi:hypothetical protein